MCVFILLVERGEGAIGLSGISSSSVFMKGVWTGLQKLTFFLNL